MYYILIVTVIVMNYQIIEDYVFAQEMSVKAIGIDIINGEVPYHHRSATLSVLMHDAC